jgi:hypothetical protein
MSKMIHTWRDHLLLNEWDSRVELVVLYGLTERDDRVQSKAQPSFPRCSALTYFRPEYA